MNAFRRPIHQLFTLLHRRIAPVALAGSPQGRMFLHLFCACRGGGLRWHSQGILREVAQSTEQFAPPVRLMQRTTRLS